MGERAEGGSGGVEEGKGEELLPEPDKLTVLVVEVCRVWTLCRWELTFWWKQGLAAGIVIFLLWSTLCNTVSYLLF